MPEKSLDGCPIVAKIGVPVVKPDVDAYVRVMRELKRRIDVCRALMSGKPGLPFLACTLESIVLQIRLCLELVALASLSAHKEVFEQEQRKFEKHWHPNKILKDLQGLNPNYFPRPVREEPADDGVAKTMLVDVTEGTLTPDELVEIHGRCGTLLHASNPYGKTRPYQQFQDQIPQWLGKVVALLNVHEVHLIDDSGFYLCQMSAGESEDVVMTEWRRVPDA